MLQNERRLRLKEPLSDLPDRHRLVCVLSHFEGKTSREVSSITGLNESTVRVHLFRAIRRLRTLLSGQSVSAAPGKGRVIHASR